MAIFSAPEPGPLYTVADAARLIADPGDDLAHVSNQLRRFAQRGDVLTRGQTGSGRTAGNLFALSDIAVARIQRTVTGLGLADAAVAQEIQTGCYFGGPGSPENPNCHPITAAILVARYPAEAQRLVFQLDSYVSDGQRQFQARIFDTLIHGREYHPAVVASIRVPLATWLPRLAARLG